MTAALVQSVHMDISKMSEKDIEENLKEILDNKSREERKANGRLIAVIVASSVIFLAIYHAWIRKTTALAGILVPALIMILYGGWVVMLAKQDKRKRAFFERKIEEMARAQKLIKAELGEGPKKATTKPTSTQVTTKNEKSKNIDDKKPPMLGKRQRSKESTGKLSPKSQKSSKIASQHRKKIKMKGSSIRPKLCRQNAVIETPSAKFVISCKQDDKKYPFVRTSSAP